MHIALNFQSLSWVDQTMEFFSGITNIAGNAFEHCYTCIGNLIGQLCPTPPRILNLMVTEVCDSRCKMCNIWTRKQEKELAPSELAAILDDPLFHNLEYIGVSGGEPTLRMDLPEIFRVITQKSSVSGTGLITNAIQFQSVIDRVEKCYKICSDADVSFNVMVSLDGIGQVHDMVRGNEGNFASALKVIRHIRDNTDIPISIGCTIIKQNVWFLDEVLEFCLQENVYGRFRIAEYINRLYNDNLKNSIRNFNHDERYQIALFFSKLEYQYEKNINVKATYRNIRQMIFEGKPRQTGCPYLNDAVGLDSRGNLIYCSPKSPVLGSCLKESAKKLYKQNSHVRRAIAKNHCGNCIHDYHAVPTREYVSQEEEEAHIRSYLSVERALEEAVKTPSAEPMSLDWSDFKKVFVLGWYGTETAGDKAILADIVHRLKEANLAVEIFVSSLYPFVTKRTLLELGMSDIRIVKTYSRSFLSKCERVDAVVMGGGPLMSIDTLGFVLSAFSAARKAGVPTILEGCGVGPLVGDRYVLSVKEILRLSTQIKVRDSASLAWIMEHADRNDAICTEDPAVGYVQRWKNQSSHLAQSGMSSTYFPCFLRELTTEYSRELGTDRFIMFKKQVEDGLGQLVLFIREKTGLKPLFVPMHTFVVGKDDREFARRFSRTYLREGEYESCSKVYSPQEILSIMMRSRLNVCMRFHSVVFAETLRKPFIAIDYTGGGKIKGYLQDKGKEDHIIDRSHLAVGSWTSMVNRVLSNYGYALGG